MRSEVNKSCFLRFSLPFIAIFVNFRVATFPELYRSYKCHLHVSEIGLTLAEFL